MPPARSLGTADGQRGQRRRDVREPGDRHGRDLHARGVESRPDHGHLNLHHDHPRHGRAARLGDPAPEYEHRGLRLRGHARPRGPVRKPRDGIQRECLRRARPERQPRPTATSTWVATTTVAASGGVATFTNIIINTIGEPFTLIASGDGVTSVPSSRDRRGRAAIGRDEPADRRPSPPASASRSP